MLYPLAGALNMDKLYIIVPAYNEEANIRSVIEEWYAIIERHPGGGDSRLVIVNDGSKDRTQAIVEECAAEKPQLTLLSKANSGHGASLLYGYRYAIGEGADYIFQTDSDGQTRPEEFEEFWQERADYDMVIGWRKGRQDGFSRVVVTKTLKLVIRLCFGVWITDANAPFRLLRASTLAQHLPLIPADYNLSNVLLSVVYAKKKLPTKYHEITFRPRQGGVNSINMRRICAIGYRAFLDFIRLNKHLSSSL